VLCVRGGREYASRSRADLGGEDGGHAGQSRAREFAHGTGEGGVVGRKAALQAAAWCEYLETHAARLYSSAENPAMEGARTLLDRIRKGM
jgi:hypothetical protein